MNQFTCSNNGEDIAHYLLFLIMDLQAIYIYMTQSCTSMLHLSHLKKTYDGIPILLHLSNNFPYVYLSH